MEIKLNYTKEELTNLIDGLNNAIIAVGDVYAAAILGCETPSKFDPLFNNKTMDEITELADKRINGLKQLYYLLESYEK